MLIYEKTLDSNLDLALHEGSSHFEYGSAVHKALRAITHKLDSLGIPYAVSGGMALFAHGYRRFTDDVDILVKPDSISKIHAALEGRGFLPVFRGSKNLRETEHGVRIEFLLSGEFPGDGKAKAVCFPNPEEAFIDLDGIKYLRLNNLIELKLASGISAAHRMRDLSDVLDLVKALHLPKAFGDQLDSSVREKYFELWDAAQEAREP